MTSTYNEVNGGAPRESRPASMSGWSGSTREPIRVAASSCTAASTSCCLLNARACRACCRLHHQPLLLAYTATDSLAGSEPQTSKALQNSIEGATMRGPVELTRLAKISPFISQAAP